MTRRSKRCLFSTQGPSCCKIPIFHAFLESLSSSYAPGSRHFPKSSFAIFWRRGQLRGLWNHNALGSVQNLTLWAVPHYPFFQPHKREIQLSSVQSLSQVWLFATPWTAPLQDSLSITNSWSLPKLMSIESVMPSNHLILCRPLFPQPIFPSIRVFSNESVLCIRWPKYWSFSFNISPSNEHPGLISFRMDWLDLLAVQGTLKSLLQHHSSKASIIWHSAFFIIQLSHPYTTTGKTIAVTRQDHTNNLNILIVTFKKIETHDLNVSYFIQPSMSKILSF